MMKLNQITRRQFVKSSGIAMVGSSLLLSGCGGSDSKKDSSNSTPKPAPTLNNNRATVFIMLDGGNDAFNTLVPTNTADYQTYQTSRNNLALQRNKLLGLNNYEYGLHPSLKRIQALFNYNKLSFVANVAPMVEPITREQFKNGTKPVPLGLMSHSDQFKHWQTANPGVRTNTGLFGKLADMIQTSKDDDDISMNISLAGSNIMQSGVSSREYAITQNGSVGLKAKKSSEPSTKRLNQQLISGFQSILNHQHNNAFLDTYISSVKFAQRQHEVFSTATSGVQINTHFEDTPLSQQLKMVAKSIAAKGNLNTKQQTFFVRYIGWDHHSELLKTHANMLSVLDDAMGSFQQALEELGIADEVVTIVGSDFGRTLTSNGNGSDHAWGGHAMVMGGPVHGGKIYGDYPSLELGSGNPLDIGNGVLIPTTSIDELYAEVLLWMGVEKNKLGEMLPNLANFYDYKNKTEMPIGFMKI